MNIAIVDDDQYDRSKLSRWLSAYLEHSPFEVRIDEYAAAEDFLAKFEPYYYDICFMDIYMSGMNGMDAARQLRQSDTQCNIVFLTSTDEYVFQGYEIQALRYLLKPFSEEALIPVIRSCLEKRETNIQKLQLPIGKKTHEIPYQKILYVITARNATEIHLQNTFLSLSARHTFSQIVEPLLSDPRFLTCSRGVVVNLAHVKEIEKNYFIMDNDDQIPISRRLYASVHDTYMDFQFEHLL